MNTHNSVDIYQNANSSTSTLRPRNARLISYLDDEQFDSSRPDDSGAASSSSKDTPLFPPSAVSTTVHSLGRARSVNSSSKSGDDGRTHARTTSEGASRSAGADLWSSWSSISGIASTLLGSDVQSSSTTSSKGKGKSNTKFKQPAWMRQDRAYAATPKATTQWGPWGTSHSPSAQQESIDEHRAKMQAKKREALLLAGATDKRDAIGRYKRRDSDTDLSQTNNGVEEDALVYLHKIKPEDTLAGVTIKYSCQPDVFRKVNRFWPNDNIQTRKHVFLPVEACSMRGKRIDHPLQAPDLLESGVPDLAGGIKRDPLTQSPTNLQTPVLNGLSHSTLYSEPLCLTGGQADDSGFRHDSWVLLPSFSDPVEIVRTTRRALGYFPRARRKSNTTLTDASTASTPKTSFDMLRHPPTHAAQTTLSLNASPVRHPSLPSHLTSTRQRASSTTATNLSFVDALRGPGGVGTLSGLRTEASRPGPADDSLNRKFAPYLPDLAPPGQEDGLRLSGSLRLTPRATPRASTDSTRSHRSNSNGEAGGALEGWMRKLAGTKSAKLTVGGGSGGNGTGGRRAKMGDLIELETNSELGEPLSNDEEDSFNHQQATPTQATVNDNSRSMVGASNSKRDFGNASAITDEEALLNERFPMRGRLMNAYGVGKDKGD